MKLKFTILNLILTAVMLFGCSEQATNDSVTGTQRTVNMTVSGSDVISFMQSATRASDGLYDASSGFDGTEQIKVYMKTASDTKSAIYDVGSPSAGKSRLTVHSGNDELTYPAEGSTSLYGVYPSTSIAKHVVCRNQSNDEAYKSSDLMYATMTVAQADQDKTQNLTFNHQLVKLKLQITKSADVNQLQGVTLNNVKRSVLVSFDESQMSVGEAMAAVTGDDGYSSTVSENNSIIVSGGETTAPNRQEIYTYACVFPSQAWSESDFLTVRADGKTTVYYLSKAFTAGQEYVVNLTLNATALDARVDIRDWGTLTDAPLNINPAVQKGGTLQLSPIADASYTGSLIEPSPMPSVTDQDNNLVSTADYNLSCFNNTNPGQAIVLVEGKNSYDGQIGFTSFNILKAQGSISYATASLTKTLVTDQADFTHPLTHDVSAADGIGVGSLTYSSADESVATVNAISGLVHILKNGTTTITATVVDGKNYTYADKTASYELTVNKAQPNVSVSGSSYSIDERKSTTFAVTRSGDGVISARSTDESVATTAVNQSTGVVTVTGVSSGSVSVIVTVAESSNYYAYDAQDKLVSVTVVPDPGVPYNDITSAHLRYVMGSNGKAYANKTAAERWSSQAMGMISYIGTDLVPGAGKGYILSMVRPGKYVWPTTNLFSWSAAPIWDTGSGLSTKQWYVLSVNQYNKLLGQLGCNGVLDLMTLLRNCGATVDYENDASNWYYWSTDTHPQYSQSGYFMHPNNAWGYDYKSNPKGIRPVLPF